MNDTRCIRGNTVGTSNPIPDWNQSDPTKADFINNKPDILPVPDTAVVGQYLRVKSIDENGRVTATETTEVSGGGSGGGSVGVQVDGETLILANAVVEDETLIL